MLKRFLLKQKPTLILLCLKDAGQQWYPSKLAKSSGTSYVYVTAWLAKLEKTGWVKLEQKGRLKVASLTEHGAMMATLLDELVKKIDAQEKVQEQASAQAAQAKEEEKKVQV